MDHEKEEAARAALARKMASGTSHNNNPAAGLPQVQPMQQVQQESEEEDEEESSETESGSVEDEGDEDEDEDNASFDNEFENMRFY